MTTAQKNSIRGYITLSGMSEDEVRDEIMRITLSRFELKLPHITGGFIGTGNKVCRDFICLLLSELLDDKQQDIAARFNINIANICRSLKKLPYDIDNDMVKRTKWEDVVDTVSKRMASYANHTTAVESIPSPTYSKYD